MNTTNNTNCINKIVVFDLDETLGYFMEFGMFWDALTRYLKDTKLHLQIPVNQELFNSVLDLYPEFLRPNIINILKYLKKKKEQDKCHKLMIYTNNQGPKTWANHIISYFETKINSKLFDQIIAAFKVQGKRVEVCRTTHLKTHQDLIKCTKIPEDTQICFIDDVFYPDMSNKNIYYINIKPYIHDLQFNTMIDRFLKSSILFNANAKININNETFQSNIIEHMKKYNHTYTEKLSKAQDIDVILSKKILHHLETFFNEQKGYFPKKSVTHNKNKHKFFKKNKTIKLKRLQ
uniref:Uncharacterized protein n=1 Tax=viral metagenome TaxID=1070528 RepID=A0A6C0IV58_9ZZZZ